MCLEFRIIDLESLAVGGYRVSVSFNGLTRGMGWGLRCRQGAAPFFVDVFLFKCAWQCTRSFFSVSPIRRWMWVGNPVCTFLNCVETRKERVVERRQTAGTHRRHPPPSHTQTYTICISTPISLRCYYYYDYV